ncbi:MAG: ATP-binding protein, partial [Bacteroidota bacterium]
DEVQYLKNWEVHLKALVDSYRGVKFVVSGSAAAALKLKSNESGAGRFTDFTLPPLTFNEYINLKSLEYLIIPATKKWDKRIVEVADTKNITSLNQHFIDYINFGGYPEVSLSEAIQQNPGRYIKSDIVDKVLLRDLPMLYGIQDVQELNSLFTTIAFNSGNEFSIDKLSVKSGGVTKNTLRKYISYLEAAYLIKVVNRIDLSGKKFKRAAAFKIYLTNPSLRSALFSPIKEEMKEFGNMVETAIYAQWFHRHWRLPFYASWRNGEVDLVGIRTSDRKPAWAVEIKWSDRFYQNPNELKSLLRFCNENNLDRAIVTTISEQGEKKVGSVTLNFIPSAIYCYTIGLRTLDNNY